MGVDGPRVLDLLHFVENREGVPNPRECAVIVGERLVGRQNPVRIPQNVYIQGVLRRPLLVFRTLEAPQAAAKRVNSISQRIWSQVSLCLRHPVVEKSRRSDNQDRSALERGRGCTTWTAL